MSITQRTCLPGSFWEFSADGQLPGSSTHSRKEEGRKYLVLPDAFFLPHTRSITHCKDMYEEKPGKGRSPYSHSRDLRHFLGFCAMENKHRKASEGIPVHNVFIK